MNVTWQHFNALGAALRRVLGLGALGNPLSQELIFARARPDRLPAFVGHISGRFEKHQALVDVYPIETAAGKVVDQRVVVGIGIIPTERKLEPVFALGGPMARA